MPEIKDNIAIEAFKLPPDAAISYLEAKGFEITWSTAEQLALNNNKVFNVVRVTKLDVLQDIRDELKRALSEGLPFREFKRNMIPRLQAKGWLSKNKLPQHRLKTIYRTNIQGSFNSGRWYRQQDNKTNRPFLEYEAVLDQSTRPSHRALDGIVRHIDSPFWKKYYPPNGYNCRCRAIALTPKEAAARGKNAKRRPTIEPDKGFSHNPGEKSFRPKKSRWDPDIYRLFQK